MDHERAESHLRLVAEAELRRATAHPRDSALTLPDVPGTETGALVLRQRSAVAEALYDLPNHQREAIALQYYADLSELETARTIGLSVGAVHAHTARGVSTLQDALETGAARVSRIAQVLTAVRALDHEAADRILDDFALALGTRRAGSPGQLGPDPRSLLRSSAAHLPLGMLLRFRPSWAAQREAPWSPNRVAAGVPGSAGPRTAPRRVIPLGQVIPVRSEDVSGEIHLLSCALTDACARFTVVVRARGEFVPPGIEHNGMYRPFAVFPVHQFTATDDRGTSYRMGFSGRRGRRPLELAGEITVHPGPPPGIRWLDLTTPGERAVRIDLNRPPDGSWAAVSERVTCPGEHLLNRMATRLLLLALAFPQETGLHPAVPRPEPFSCVTDGLGDVVAALQACGALSALSPVPGQLAALCANLNVSGHGIAAPPARELPEPWLSLLAHYRRRGPERRLGRDGCAAVAAAFPALDGIRLSILGLNNADDTTVLYAHATGSPDVAADFPLRVWVRDSGGRWHATRVIGWNENDDGEMTMRLEVVPPLSHAAAWVDVLAAGSSAEARVTLPVRWRLAHLSRGGPAARRPWRRRCMATSADAAMVAMRRVTGIFPGAGVSWDGASWDGPCGTGACGTGAPEAGACGTGESAVGGSAAGDGGSGPRARSASAGLPGGSGLEWSPVCQVRDRITWVGVSLMRSVRREALVSRSSSCCAVGRLPGSLARVASTSGRSASGTAAMSGSPYMIRYRIEWVFPAPNGDRPVAAYATVTPQAKMSASGPGCPLICSGAMKPSEPIIMPVLVMAVVSCRRAMPKSMTFGPASVRMMLDGLRSRCMIPAAWITASASASPVARPYSNSGPTEPCLSMCSDSEGPWAYSVTTNGVADWESASITRTVHTPLTRTRAATSRPNRRRNSSSPASSGRSTFTATGVPSQATPRYTTPMPPEPSRAVSR